ncbi:MAG: hypothetical protein LBL41_00365 [Bifidobacteriaceae bacterium]|jgi:hypothetical protein|nr:hypothetical protein [Bifidobacteriaceae bacterium]
MLNELRLNKKVYFSVFIVEAVLLALFSALFAEVSYTNSTLSAIEEIDDTNVYVNFDCTLSEQLDSLFENDTESIKRGKELYNYVAKGRTKYSYWDYPVGTLANGKPFFQATTDKYFFDLYGIKVAVGQNLYDVTETKSGSIPVVVGADLTEKYQLHDVFEMEDPNTGKGVKYEVVGILPKGTTYPAVYNIGMKNSVDDKMFRPLDVEALNEIGNLVMSIASLVVFANNETDLRKIEQLSKDLNFLDMSFEKISDNTVIFLQEGKETMQIYALIIIALIILAVLIGGIAIYIAIKKKLNVYIVQITAGLSLKKLCLNIFFALFAVNVVLIILSLAFSALSALLSDTSAFNSYYFSSSTLNVYYYAIISLVFLFIDAIISLIPYLKLRNADLLNILRSENG